MKKSYPKKIKTSYVVILIIILASLFYTYVIEPGKKASSTAVDGVLSLHMINVGQGDALLLELNNQYMLVDSGPNAAEDDFLDYLDECGIDELQYAVFTHPHIDHIGSGDAVLDRYKVDTVIMSDAETTTKAFENLLDAVENEKCDTIIPKQGDEFMLDNAKITVLSVDGKEYDDLNKYSLVLRVDYGKTSFLLTGDSFEENEKDIMESEYSPWLDCDLIKIAHHGSVSSTSDEFLEKVSPEFAFISCGAGNDYGHPHYETTRKLSKAGVKIYRTDYNGTVVAESDGTNIKIKTEF